MAVTDLLVVGSSPLSLACVHRAATNGARVTWVRTGEAFERACVGALLPFPLALGSGVDLATALRSRGAWLAIAMELETWHRRTGSLSLAFEDHERERLATFLDESDEAIVFCEWVEPEAIVHRLPVWSRDHGALGALWSSAEVVVDPAEFERRVRGFLVERHAVCEVADAQVVGCDARSVRLADGTRLEAGWIVLDEDVLPEAFPRRGSPGEPRGFARTEPQGGTWHLEPIPILEPFRPVAEQVLLVEDAQQALRIGAPRPIPPHPHLLRSALGERARGLALSDEHLSACWTTPGSRGAAFDLERDEAAGLAIVHARGDGAFTLAFAHAEPSIRN